MKNVIRKIHSLLSEKRIAFLLILPALLVVLVIVIWPLFRSMWISLYDIRLNDPAKSQMHTAYQIDMEWYVGTLPTLLDSLNTKIQEADGQKKQQFYHE